MASAETTTDHETIRRWTEERGGHPACVKGTGDDGDVGLLRIDFNEPEEKLQEITWDEFFEKFEERKLAFLYQEEKDGKQSRFFKLVNRE